MPFAIRVENLSKCYRLGLTHAGSIRELVNRATRRLLGRTEAPLPHELIGAGPRVAEQGKKFWALRDVSFEVQPGEVVGLIGHNGAGKSTLLKILSRITGPTAGRVEMRGRISSLLEVGTGFHPELTGRENVFLNGAILGMTKAEIRRKFDAIVDFAEIAQFIDTPVKRYSSGMYVRLAFAVAAHLEPEILVIDEVLAVGDVAFQRKCLGKMGAVARQGRTVLFVSHNMQAVRTLCEKAVWLQDGKVFQIGNSGSVVEEYLKDNTKRGESKEPDEYLSRLPLDPNFRLDHVSIRQDDAETRMVFRDRPVEVFLRYGVLKQTPGLHVFIQLHDTEGTLLLESIDNGDSEELPVVTQGDYETRVIIPGEFLAPRPYVISVQVAIANVRNCFPEAVHMGFDVLPAGKFNQAYPGYVTPGKLAPLLEWRTAVSTSKAGPEANQSTRPPE